MILLLATLFRKRLNSCSGLSFGRLFTLTNLLHSLISLAGKTHVLNLSLPLIERRAMAAAQHASQARQQAANHEGV
jgi:hypothetical protein